MTYQRGHKAVMNTHSVGGNSEDTVYVGMDQYGNKYYEDFRPLYRRQSRWVEYNHYTTIRTPNGHMIPPKWQGWLTHTYDDVPLPDSDSFYDPFFEQPHRWGDTFSVNSMHTSRFCIINPRHVEFIQYRKNRYAKEWDAKTYREE